MSNDARIASVEAALRAVRIACFLLYYPSCKPNIDLTKMGILACHTPLGMTWPKSLIHNGLGCHGTLCLMTKKTSDFS